MKYQCLHCHAWSELVPENLLESGQCSACQSERPILDEPLDIDEKEFWEIVTSLDVPILVDFWAAWCGPCQMAAPEVHQTAIDMAGKAVVLKVNTEQSPNLAKHFGVRSIPRFLLLQQKKILFEEGGLFSAEEMNAWIQDVL